MKTIILAGVAALALASAASAQSFTYGVAGTAGISLHASGVANFAETSISGGGVATAHSEGVALSEGEFAAEINLGSATTGSLSQRTLAGSLSTAGVTSNGNGSASAITGGLSGAGGLTVGGGVIVTP